ncbi:MULTISPECIES: hypothetical protein [unclassified Streptomyces]|uniref:hypothetical protein n=1 Tax=unclassified Streptomyces TaxID=2593676 RepID=UPI0036314EFD
MPQNYWTRRYVLRGENLRLSIEKQAKRLRWKHRSTTKADHSKGIPFTEKWSAPEGVFFMLVEDGLSGESCVMWGGADERVVTETAARACADMDVWTLPELLESLDEAESVPTVTKGVLRCGLGAPPEFDENVFDRISSLLASEISDLRAAAAWAITYNTWPEYRKPLERAFLSEKDQEVRAVLGSILESMDELGIGE